MSRLPCIKRDGRYLCEKDMTMQEFKRRKKYKYLRNTNFISYSEALKAHPDFKFCEYCSKVFFEQLNRTNKQV